MILIDHTEISTDYGDRRTGDRGTACEADLSSIVDGSIMALVRLHYCSDAICEREEALHLEFLLWKCAWYS